MRKSSPGELLKIGDKSYKIVRSKGDYIVFYFNPDTNMWVYSPEYCSWKGYLKLLKMWGEFRVETGS